MARLQPINFFSIGNNGSTAALRSSSLISVCDITLSRKSRGQLAKGGVTPLKKSHEINSPTQTTKPNRLTR
jgi:hypothetical protein